MAITRQKMTQDDLGFPSAAFQVFILMQVLLSLHMCAFPVNFTGFNPNSVIQGKVYIIYMVVGP